jgi:hypothetical protein
MHHAGLASLRHTLKLFSSFLFLLCFFALTHSLRKSFLDFAGELFHELITFFNSFSALFAVLSFENVSF